MQKKYLGLLLIVAVLVGLGLWWSRRSVKLPESITSPATVRVAPEPRPAPATSMPAPVVAARLTPAVSVTPALPPAIAPSRLPAASVSSANTAVQPVSPATPDVAIQEQKTIDFSNGRAVIKDSAEDKAVIDSAVKEMDAATKNITFSPTAAPSTGTPAKPVQK